MNITLQAMQPIDHGANIESKVEDVHLHMRLSEGELPEVGVDYAYLGPEGSQVTKTWCASASALGAWLRHRCQRRA